MDSRVRRDFSLAEPPLPPLVREQHRLAVQAAAVADEAAVGADDAVAGEDDGDGVGTAGGAGGAGSVHSTARRASSP